MNKEDEDLIAKLISEEFEHEAYQEDSFINYDTSNTTDEMQRQMNQVLETANLLRWEYENNLMNERIDNDRIEEERKRGCQRDIEDRRKLIEEQNKEYEEEMNRNKPPEIPPHYSCPISKKIMENPIFCNETQKHYEKAVLIKHLNENNNILEGIIIQRTNLTINNNLKQEIFYWKREHPNFLS
jgi:hypothetical protein